MQPLDKETWISDPIRDALIIRDKVTYLAWWGDFHWFALRYLHINQAVNGICMTVSTEQSSETPSGHKTSCQYLSDNQTHTAEEDDQSADRNLQIRGRDPSPGCGPRNLEGLCLWARCSPVEGSGGDRSPPPSAPSPLLWTPSLWKVEDRGMEMMKRRRRMESDPVSFYPSCDQNKDYGSEQITLDLDLHVAVYRIDLITTDTTDVLASSFFM